MTKPLEVTPCQHPRYSFRVRFFAADGKRKDRYFVDETSALDFVQKQNKELGMLGTDFGFVAEDERSALSYWRAFVASVPETPPPALLAVLKEYAGTWKANRASVTVEHAAKEFQAAKESEGLRANSLQALKSRCKRFVDDFGKRPISSITTAEISKWILSLPVRRQAGRPGVNVQVGLLAKKNQRLVLSNLFNYSKTQGWVTLNPVTDAARPKPGKTRPGILRPGEVNRLFEALAKVAQPKKAPNLVPFWALRFFAGVREQECLRMDWRMVDLEAQEINLPDTVTKTGKPRTIKIETALAEFLEPLAKTEGGIVTKSAMIRRTYLAKACRILQAEDKAAAERGEEITPFPVPMPANSGRHSYATYHVLAFRHAGETAIQLGHGQDPEMLHRHYKGIATEREAKLFWKIRPTKAENAGGDG